MMKVTFRFYEELNDFLPPHRKKTDFQVTTHGKRSVKDMIESMGVPHTEIDLILINGRSVDFDYCLKDQDRISVYPVFESLNLEDVTHLREKPLRKTRFTCDVNLNHIVKYMRALGFDVYFDPSLSNGDMIQRSKSEGRIILTQNKKLLKFRELTHAVYIRPGSVTAQIKWIINHLDIKSRAKPFSRCLRCNRLLARIPREAAVRKVPPRVRAFCHEFARCEKCRKIYWKGSHYRSMNEVVKEILD